ncbi:MAG: hypothetical protein JO046_03565, partial [Solirubrobacterales bacterium]|nr:hypothetical protein [Solirubrobacterales bacterium]
MTKVYSDGTKAVDDLNLHIADRVDHAIADARPPEEISSSPATIRSLAQPHTSRWCSSATRSIRIWFGNLRDFGA